MTESSGYKNIFKSTFLFGFVQIFNILFKVGINKIVAIFLGSAGMGVISLFQQSTALLSAACGLGINQSAIRDIADARESNDHIKVNDTINLVRHIIKYTSLLGIIVTIILSPLLSQWTFGNNQYILSYICLSLMTGTVIQTMGYVAINTGMRQLKNVALSNLCGSMAGFMVAIPFYYFLQDNGIVPSLTVSSFVTFLISRYYARKVKYKKVRIRLMNALKRSKNTINMGISLMLMSLMLTLSSLILSSYISHNGGVSIVGLYQAGATIVVSYFAVIISAMSTEYYPRICGFHNDDAKLKQAVNAQSETGLVLALPLVVIFVFLVPYFLKFLYSDAFLEASNYTDFAIIGSIAIICSNCMGMILLAKQNSRVFLISSFVGCILTTCISIVLYNYSGLIGLGIGYAFNGLFQFTMYEIIMRRLYGVSFDRRVIINLLIVLIIAIGARFMRFIDINWLKWSSGSVCSLLCIIYTLWYMKKYMGLNLINFVKNRICSHH